VENSAIEKQENYLEKDGNIAFLLGVHKLFKDLGDESTAEICDTYIEGVSKWASKNISNWSTISNKEYYGWIIYFNNTIPQKMVIPMYIYKMISNAKNWEHAKDLFIKYSRKIG
jgi:hypothetical protein